MSEIQKQSELKLVSIGNDAQYINQQIELGNQAFGKSLEHYRNAGERLAIVRDDFKAKGQRVKGIGFKPWVEQNCDCKFVHIYRYISVYQNWNELVSIMHDTNEIFTLVDALKAIKDIKAKSLESDDEYIQATATKIEQANAEIEAEKKRLTTESKEIEKLKLEAMGTRFRAEQLEREAEAKADKLYNETLDKAVEDASTVRRK